MQFLMRNCFWGLLLVFLPVVATAGEGIPTTCHSHTVQCSNVAMDWIGSGRSLFLSLFPFLKRNDRPVPSHRPVAPSRPVPSRPVRRPVPTETKITVLASTRYEYRTRNGNKSPTGEIQIIRRLRLVVVSVCFPSKPWYK